ncbi:uncharacterized protein si:ch211-106e7.2 [Electrophorus electricus]|uniref:uncharacterized protein si:ch211-106e7.2 n=1 Tax=Electrophorus electricus TaxID=8005 RepID=UPI0015D0893F|nr:uncharacterized protein si:ch211-106e7.2 [Electrophorus electricus]
MAKLGELGNYPSGYPDCISANRRIQLETILRDQQRVLYEGQITIGSYWTKPSQSLQAISDQILTHPQYSGEPHLRQAQGYYNRNSEWVSPLGQNISQTILRENSVGSIQRPAEQTSNHGYTTMFSEDNYPCHKLTPCFPYKGPPEAPSSMSQASHPQSLTKVQQKMLTDHKHFGALFPVGNPLSSLAHQVCSEYFKNQSIMNRKSKVDHVNRNGVVPYKKRKPFFVTVSEDNTGFVAENVILADQVVRQPYYPYACISKESHHERHVPQKAVAVVTPLAQQVVPCAKFSKNLCKLNKGPESKSVANNQDHQSYALLSLRTNERGSKFPCNMGGAHVSQKVPSESVLAGGFSELADTANFATSELNSQSNRSCSVLTCISRETKELAQSSHMEDHSSTDFLQKNNVTVANKGYERTESPMDMEPTEKWSYIPITEWSLQRLRTLVADSEQMQKENLKDIPFIDLNSEIVKLYWDGDDQKLCNAISTGHYINIMKQVRLHSGTENSVILKEISKEKLYQADEDSHILKPDIAPPKMVNKSSYFNHNDRENNSPSSSMTFCRKIKIVNGATVEEQKIIEETENKQANTGNAVSGPVVFSQALSTHLPTKQERNCTSVMGTKFLIKEPICMDNENKGTNKDAETVSPVECLNKQSSVMTVNVSKNFVIAATEIERTETESENKWKNFARETGEQEQLLMDCVNMSSSTMTVNHRKNVVMRHSAAELIAAEVENEEINLEKSPSNEGCLPLSLQSPAMSVKPGGPPATVLSPPSVSCDDANCTDPFAFVKINILSPEKAKRFFFGESNEKVENKEKKIRAQPYTDNSDQVIVKLLDGVSEHKEHVDTKIKPTERNIRSHTTDQISYCCVSKWFQVLGYENDELCMCEKNAELNPSTEASSEVVKETNGTISTTANSCVTSCLLYHASMDEIETVDVHSSDEGLPKIVNVMDSSLSQCGSHDSTKKRKQCTLMHTDQEKNLHQNGCSQLVFKTNFSPDIKSDASQMDLHEINTFLPLISTENTILRFGEKRRETKNPEHKRKGRLIHLALYGSSDMHRNKITSSCMRRKICGIRSSDKVHLPAETISIMVDSDCSDYSSKRSRITNEQILNNQVPSEMPTDNRMSEDLKIAELESKIAGGDNFSTEIGTLSTAFDMTGICKEDIQTCGSESTKNRFCSTANPQQNPNKQSKNKQHMSSWAKIRKQQKKESKSVRSSIEMTRTEQRCRSDKGLLLDFKVLPESFKLTHDLNTTASDQSTHAKIGPKVKTPCQKKKTDGKPAAWCMSPWKKRHFKSTQASNRSGSCSTFQEFKRRYEQIKQRLT